MNVPPDRFMPLPGAPALEARRICDELNTKLALVAPHGIQDWAFLTHRQAIDGHEARRIIVSALDWDTRLRLKRAA